MMLRRRLLAFAIFMVSVAIGAPVCAALGPLGWLGVRIRDLSETEMEDLSIRHGVREGYGVVVVEVLSGTPAAQAGIQNGDLVVAIQGQAVVEVRALQRQVAQRKIGDELLLTVFRDGRRQAVKARVGQMPLEVVAERVAGELGFAFRVQRDGEGIGIASPGARESVMISGVAPGSPAERADLKAGDRLVRINGSEVESPQALRELLAGHDPLKPLSLEVQRGGRVQSLRVSPPTDRNGK